jgi:hypothetical protein
MKRTRRKPGPSPLPPKELRTLHLNIPINQAERIAYEAAAGRTPLSRWARAILNAKVGIKR